MKGKVMKGVVIRQVAPMRRYGLGKIKFDDNAILLTDEKGLVRKGVTRGVIAREITANPLFAEVGGKIV